VQHDVVGEKAPSLRGLEPHVEARMRHEVKVWVASVLSVIAGFLPAL
jgi:hypothetical protein